LANNIFIPVITAFLGAMVVWISVAIAGPTFCGTVVLTALNPDGLTLFFFF
jgi:hypothetical protein